MFNQWELKVKTGNLLEARENVSDHIRIGLSFVFDWLRWWREFFLDQSQIKVRQTQSKPGLLSKLNWKLFCLEIIITHLYKCILQRNKLLITQQALLTLEPTKKHGNPSEYAEGIGSNCEIIVVTLFLFDIFLKFAIRQEVKVPKNPQNSDLIKKFPKIL